MTISFLEPWTVDTVPQFIAFAVVALALAFCEPAR